MITELREAIATKLKTVATRVYYLTAPSSVTYPYVVFREVTEQETRDSASKFPSVPVDVSVYDQNLLNAETLANTIKTLLSDSENTFTLSNHYVISVNKAYGPRPIPYPDNVTQYVSEFDFELQKK